jgi:hypothetical protein
MLCAFTCIDQYPVFILAVTNAKAETLRVSVGTPEDVPKKVK